MAEYKSIQEIQKELANLLTSDPSGFASTIDKFDYNEIVNSLSNYWNDSVEKLYDTLMEIIPSNNWDETYGQGHDASYSFAKSPYVNPNTNELGEDYLSARNDEIESVLKNEDNLDYTIGDYRALTTELKKYMTKLLMPQYERRVEVEDLNRNFWVIGQNLTALNKVVFDIGDEFIKKLVGELTGLWDNVYRIWQALFSINDKVYSIGDNEKVRFMMAYGFGTSNEDNTTIDAISFTKDNAYQYGILPYICKKRLVNSSNEVCYAYYMPYNRRLDNVLIENKSHDELLTDFNADAAGLGLIKMDCQFTNRNIEKMLKTIRERNFVLVAKSKEDLLPYLNRTQYPLLTALDFYRDYLYYVQNADLGSPLSTLIQDTSIWKQSGYLQYIDFIEASDANSFIDTSVVADNVISAFGYIKDLFKDSLDLTFVNSVIKLQSGDTIKDLKNIIGVSENHNIDTLITDLYKLFVKCQELIGMTPRDYSNNDGTSEEPQYTINTQEDTFVNDFIAALREYEKIDSLDGNGTYQSVSQKMDLPYINWDLLSMTNERIEDINSDFGQSYCFKYNAVSKEDHLWIDFVADINRDSYIENGRSTIGSYTGNDLRNGIDKDDLFYDLNITVPLNKATSSSDIPKYIDFVRLGRPYPNFFSITDNVSSSNDLNDIKHLNSLNIMDNWIGYQVPGSTDNYYYCIDGFYPFSNNGYKNINETENLVSNNSYANYQLSNILTYNIASSDLIDCRHTNDGSGQTRINNEYNFENPVVNLRFINGRTDSQEIEIVITKDVTQKDLRKVYERFYEVTSVTIDNLDEQYDVFLGPYGKQGNASNNPYPNADNPQQHIFGSVGEIADKSSSSNIINLGSSYDLLYSYYSGDKYYYRIRTHSHSTYTHMAKLTDNSGNLITGTTLFNGTSGYNTYDNNNIANGSVKSILTTDEAINKAMEVLINDVKYCIVLKNIYNRVSTDVRSKNQMAGIYIGSLVKKEEDNIIELGQLNKVISASTLSTHTDRGNDRVIFAQEEYGGVGRLYGHITPYKTKTAPSIGDINSWGWSIVAQTFLPEVSSTELKGEGYVCLIDAVQAIDALNPNFIVNTSDSQFTVVEQLSNELKRLYPKGLVDINKPKDPNNLKLKDYVYLWIPFTIDETAENKIVINEEKIKWTDNFRQMSKETTGWWYHS